MTTLQPETICVTPVGRIVWGSPTKAVQRRDSNNNPMTDQTTGAPLMQRAFGLAIQKTEFAEVQAKMVEEVSKLFNSGVPAGFSWKVVDGDGIDGNGKPYAEREGYAGCMVISISSSLDEGPGVFRYVGQAYVQHGDEVKPGDYVRVQLGLRVHSGNKKQRGLARRSLRQPEDGPFRRLWRTDHPRTRCDGSVRRRAGCAPAGSLANACRRIGANAGRPTSSAGDNRPYATDGVSRRCPAGRCAGPDVWGNCAATTCVAGDCIPWTA